MLFIHDILCALLLICAFLASFAINPVESVLFLILCFCISGTLLFLLNSDFLALIYIVVYVGAVAVLFLFVIMMLNVKLKENMFERLANFNYNTNVFVIIACAFAFLNMIIFIFSSIFSVKSISYQEITQIQMIDNLNTIDVFAQVLFNYNTGHFLIAGFILLVALIGSIIITLNFKNKAF